MIDLLILIAVISLCVIIPSLLTNVVPFRGYFLQYLYGYTKVKLYDGQYHFNEDFITWVKFDEDIEDDIKGYRFPSTKIGVVNFKRDGTAEYCGHYKWKAI